MRYNFFLCFCFKTHYLFRKAYYDYDEARRYYELALKLNPSSSRTHLELGNLLSKHFEDWEEAKKHYMCSMLVRGDYDKPYKYVLSLSFSYYFSRMKRRKVVFLSSFKKRGK